MRAIYNPQRKLLRLELVPRGRDIAREEKHGTIPHARWEISHDDQRLALLIHEVEMHLLYRDVRDEIVIEPA